MPISLHQNWKKPTMPGSCGNNCTGNVWSQEEMNPPPRQCDSPWIYGWTSDWLCLKWSISSLQIQSQHPVSCSPPGTRGGTQTGAQITSPTPEGQPSVGSTARSLHPGKHRGSVEIYDLHRNLSRFLEFSEVWRTHWLLQGPLSLQVIWSAWGKGKTSGFAALLVAVALAALIWGKHISHFFATTSEHFEAS